MILKKKNKTTLNLILLKQSRIFCLTYSGFDEIMPPHRIRAVLGLHAISEFKNKNNINQINTAYEIELRNIVVHPEYACKRPYNDIGSKKK